MQHGLFCTPRDEYEALFGKGTGPLVLARTDSLVTDGFGEFLRHLDNTTHPKAKCLILFLKHLFQYRGCNTKMHRI